MSGIQPNICIDVIYAAEYLPICQVSGKIFAHISRYPADYLRSCQYRAGYQIQLPVSDPAPKLVIRSIPTYYHGTNIKDGNSVIGAQVRSNLFYLICLRHLIRMRAVTNRITLLRKYLRVRQQF